MSEYTTLQTNQPEQQSSMLNARASHSRKFETEAFGYEPRGSNPCKRS